MILRASFEVQVKWIILGLEVSFYFVGVGIEE
jgi:hypothetical protein